jgi:hypothetical protein
VSGSGGWQSLVDIYAEAAADLADEAGQPPAACPNDGEPLREGRGGLYCPFDGWRPGAADPG